MKKRSIVIFLICLAVCAGCRRHPLKKTQTLLNEGLLPGVAATFIVYDDELKTGGNLFLYPGGENQVVDLAWRNSPYRGSRCIRYTWNGGDVSDGSLGITRHDFVGLDLAVSKGSDDFPASSAVDLSIGGYTKISFLIRGSLSADTTLKIEAVDDGDSSSLPAQLLLSSLPVTWERKEIAVPAADFASIKEYLKITFIYTQPAGTSSAGTGGEVYLDEIILEQ